MRDYRQTLGIRKNETVPLSRVADALSDKAQADRISRPPAKKGKKK